MELYDLVNDISEQNDLSSALPELTDKLRAKLHKWYKGVDAQMPIANPYYSPDVNK